MTWLGESAIEQLIKTELDDYKTFQTDAAFIWTQVMETILGVAGQLE